MKKENGFTLSELLGVIIILALLALIIGRSVVKNISEAKGEISASQEKAILNAAEKWAVENSDRFDDIEGSVMQIGLDVVFVLDMSGSMTTVDVVDNNGKYISRNRAMIEATDAAMKELGVFENNRMAVVLYGNESIVYLDLAKYNSTDSNFIYYSGRSSALSRPVTSINQVTEYINVANGLTRNDSPYRKSKQKLSGCTYTQSGISAGANILLNTEDSSNRIPVIIMLSDGAPSYGTTNYKKVGANNVGKCATEGDYQSSFYTILSAKYYKDEVRKHYNNNSTFFYTVGLALNSGSYEEVVLNPTDELVSNLTTNRNSIAKSLSETLQKNGGKDFSYADGSFIGKMDSLTLKNLFLQISNEVIEATKITQLCVTVEDLYEGGYLTTKEVKLADGQSSSEYVIMSMNEATNQYTFSMAKTEEQKNQCKTLLSQSS